MKRARLIAADLHPAGVATGPLTFSPGDLMKSVYLLVGSPGSGKTWVMGQLKSQFEIVEHDDFKTTPQAYAKILTERAHESSKPILGNTPFGLSEIILVLATSGIKCTPVFILEPPHVLATRYMARERKQIPQGHLTRQNTYKERAEELGAFSGTSDEVLSHLKGI